MTTLRNPGINFPILNGLAALIITGLLLILCVQLVKFTPPAPNVKHKPMFINYVPPADLPDPIEEEVITPKPINPVNNTLPERIQYEALPDLNTGINKIGNVPIPVVKSGDIITTPRKIPDIYTLSQVDRKPRVIRPFTPIYPYDAQRKGIEGNVVLRFVVDENGMVQNPEVIKAEPAGVFEQAALAAIVKYKFDPAVVNTKKVKCYAVLPIGFRLN
ncbi:MAG: TonB family protein [Desulfatiglans sp.]|jgi:protein TonB|nr:TonB family protein [Desulfatiglans sp.]